MGMFAAVGGILAPQSVKYFNRRTLIVGGHLLVSIALGLFSFSIHFG